MIKLTALHHLRFSVQDLQRTQDFASDFGLHKVSGDDSIVYMRGAGCDAYNYVAQRSNESKLAAIAFSVTSLDDLRIAVEQHGATAIRQLTGPGGGQAVSLHDPDGLPIDLVFGIAEREPEPLRPGLVLNFGYDKQRKNKAQHLPPKGPPQLMRLGHVGIFVKDYARCSKWYREVLGLLLSDQLYAGDPEHKVVGFYRINRGDEPVDHHTVFLAEYGKSDLHHISFEVQDFEAQFMAHTWLTQRGWEPVWGIGRHGLGCHIFDVWMDPNGYRFETFTDTDLFDAQHQPGLHNVHGNPVDTWSDESPERYFGPMPEEMLKRMAEQKH
ncbi:MAG: VOC family protein [Steroidobacteraceae bacterium]